ncbi:hypothetical protein GH714_043139 [Hevea brasiliensis]|uniref:Myb-like domain-containing protein n=1 Tax=Hevea brasiliensis TaxID=3981 RepID=A0A6A6K5U8_HEVBR|nr:hypothetical protein GH714_043139 [Hevea brasiliensis]
MEAKEAANEFQKKGTKRRKGVEDSSKRSGNAGAPRTRSQVAPDWTTKEALILVNEIAAVEGDCLRVLSSYQKWKIIVENCTVLDLPRTANQCRSKWNSLLAEYNQIKQWDSKSKNDSYCFLDCERRKQLGLPENFDNELFKAIDDYVRAQKDRPDTDPDTDPEAQADLLHVIAKLGSKRKLNALLGEKPQNCCTKEQPLKFHTGEEPQNSWKGEKPQNIQAEEKPQKTLMEEKPKNDCTQKRKITGTEEMDQMMVDRLRENAEFIHAIVQENPPEIADFGAADFVRGQGDKLIACLGDIVNILNQCPHLVQASD